MHGDHRKDTKCGILRSYPDLQHYFSQGACGDLPV
uniref:Kininogen 1 n=1 Tax=Myotis myotis TaxID=51298 RepID=A0A7J7ZXZ2_MYOMY|nr:kininogen 1 [Myotis myotis]